MKTFALLLTLCLLWASHAPAQIVQLKGLTDSTTGIAYRVKTREVSADALVLSTDHTLLVSASSAAVTLSLPAAGTNTATKHLVFQKTDSTANTVTIDGDGSETIDGSTTYLLRNRYQTVILEAGFSSWHVIATSDDAGIATLTASSTPSFAPFGTLTHYTLTPGEDETIAGVTTYARKGRTYRLIVVTSGTTSRTLTFGANFKSTGTLATGTTTAKTFVVTFTFDGTNFLECSRTAAQ
jgi:hypothetical protein